MQPGRRLVGSIPTGKLRVRLPAPLPNNPTEGGNNNEQTRRKKYYVV